MSYVGTSVVFGLLLWVHLYAGLAPCLVGCKDLPSVVTVDLLEGGGGRPPIS